MNDSQRIDQDANIDETKKIKFRGDAGDNENVILKVDLKKGLGFGKQNQTIISWYQEDIEEDLAISFLDQWDCFSTYAKICTDLGVKYDSEICIPDRGNLEKLLATISSPTEEYYDLQFSAFTSDHTY